MNATRGDIKGGTLTSLTDLVGGGPVPGPVLLPDLRTDEDLLGHAPAAAFLAEVVLHRAAETPFCIGVLGPAGSGKSSFLARMLDSVERLGRAADDAGLATPFEARATVVRLRAQARTAPNHALMREVSTALVGRYPKLVAAAALAGHDARDSARDAGERLNEARRRLDEARRHLDTMTGQHATLADTLLFETTGSRVDAYTRGRRGRIERSLRGFGVASDPLVAFKGAVREAGEAASPVARGMRWCRAFWAYRGQGRLLASAIVLVLIAWCIGFLSASEPKLVDAVRSGGDKLGATADWMEAHWAWLGSLKTLLTVAALACLGLNVLRAVRFLLPVEQGAVLLRADLETRRRDLDGLLAHQTRRVDTLAREVEGASRHAADAERRVAQEPSAGLPQGLAGSPDDGRAFFTLLGKAIADQTATESEMPPARLVVGLDGLEDLPSGQAAAFVRTVATSLQAPGIVTLVAAERLHLLDGLAEADPALAGTRFDRLIQIPYDLEAGLVGASAAAFARALLTGPGPGRPRADPSTPDATVSSLDNLLSKTEIVILETLAPWAGTGPRAIKRFVNLYRVARADPQMAGATVKEQAALAAGLALRSGYGLDLDGEGGDAPPDSRAAAMQAVAAALKLPLDGQGGERGDKVARLYGAGH